MKSFRDIRVIPVVAGRDLRPCRAEDRRPRDRWRLRVRLSAALDQAVLGAGDLQLSDRQDPKPPDPDDITGSVDEKPKEGGRRQARVAAPEAAKPDGTVLYPDPSQPVSPSERAILERLQARRQELEARAREIDIRESLLKAAEKRVESQVEELKGVESRISTATEQKNEADAARFKGIITMYEGMKPKDAAKVFDRLEMPVLFEIASQIAPRKMSDILGLMSPEAAERLTIEMARRAGSDKSASAAELPKIEGKMLPQKPN